MWTFIHKLASPPHFYRYAAVMIPWFAAIGVPWQPVYGIYAGLVYCTGGLSAGRCISHHLRACSLGISVDDGVFNHGDCRGDRPHLAHQSCRMRSLLRPLHLGAWFTFLALVTGNGLGGNPCGEPGGNGVIQG